MNILIVGNGFDLSHYLPTKYDHFMVAMGAIENWDTSNGDMGFDNLFDSLYEEEDYFFSYTKAMYKTEDVKITVNEIKKLKEELKENVWYQYFSDHVKTLKTWIDFELKIKEAIIIVCDYLNQIESYSIKNNSFKDLFKFLKSNNSDYFLTNEKIRILSLLNILQVQYRKVDIQLNGLTVNYDQDWNHFNVENSDQFLNKMQGYDNFFYHKATKFLTNSLMSFNSMFSDYLELIEKFDIKLPKISTQILDSIDRVYSFNYTSTFNKNYKLSVASFFLHGKIGEKNNVVLGISDLDTNILRKYDLWEFTKYHQKLLLETDYKFVVDLLKRNDKLKIEMEITKDFWVSKSASGAGSVKYIKEKLEKVLEENSLNTNFYIWGHSLDSSDEIYIKELFSFNEPYDQKVTIKIFHFDPKSKSDILGNLFFILGKAKVEKWMKNSWLEFEKNPDIAEINKIQPVELPKAKIELEAS